ncbi:hypothetical protein K8R33_01625 [archaeon]|nr:hypothetical protein [archaeon]
MSDKKYNDERQYIGPGEWITPLYLTSTGKIQIGTGEWITPLFPDKNTLAERVEEENDIRTS